MTRHSGFSSLHAKHTAKQSANERDASERDLSHAARSLGGEVQNASDVGWLEGLLKHLKLLEVSRGAILRSLAWLKERPSKPLNSAFRQRFRSIELALGMLDRGVTPDPTKRRPRAFRKREPLPAWMLDPSLLPKSPPGR